VDTPVKRYSSGMYVRLAFAVAAYLEPEILIVDEVLAVGDAEFQRKCISKMKDVNDKDGRTVLFVSHNLSQVQSLCTHGILLENGQLAFEGSINNVITKYVHGKDSSRLINLSSLPRAGNSIPGFRFLKMQIKEPEDNIYENAHLKIKIDYEVSQPLNEVLLGITFSDAFQTLVECRSSASHSYLSFNEACRGEVEVMVPLSLAAGNYTINLGARSISGLLEYIPSAANIEILPDPNDQTEAWKKPSSGIVITSSEWSFLNATHLNK
jgi:lipopolysaccharide transport system ATP-binding protein